MMMGSRNIRVDEEVMARLLEIKARLERARNRPASMNDAVRILLVDLEAEQAAVEAEWREEHGGLPDEERGP